MDGKLLLRVVKDKGLSPLVMSRKTAEESLWILPLRVTRLAPPADPRLPGSSGPTIAE